MRAECIESVSKAIGRNITRAEANGIEERLRNTMKELARKDPPAWRGMSLADRMAAGAQEAAQGLIAEAAKKKQRVGLQVLAHDRNMNRYESLVAKGHSPFAALSRRLDEVDIYAKGVAKQYFGGLLDTINGIDSKWLGMVEDAATVQKFVREVMGEKTGDVRAEKAAKAWLETVEQMRQRFNRSGGDIGKLDYGYMPQPHDQIRVGSAGVGKWVDGILPKLDRNRYVDADGNLLDDDQMRQFLGEAWRTISEGGLNKMEPGKPMGTGSRANRGMDHRQIHFKDADSYFSYMSEYARGGIFDAMQGHVGRLAKDISLVEEMGPNPENMFRFMHDTAKKTGDSDIVTALLVRTVDKWASMSGATGMPANVKLADIGQGARNTQVFSKLGGALLSSVTDIPTHFATLGFNRLPVFEGMKNLVLSFGKDAKDFANQGGMMADSIISDMIRFAEGNIGAGVTGKLANATMNLSMLNAWTNAHRRAFGISMMAGLSRMTKSEWGNLHRRDRAILEAKGVTETDYKVWQMAKQEQWRGTNMLTIGSLGRIDEATLAANGMTRTDLDRASSRFLGFLADESEFASVSQDLTTQAAIQRSTQRGTLEGEFARSFMLFKGFPLAMISRHWTRVADAWRDGDKALAVGYGAGLTTALTIFGAMAMQMKDLVAGKDPRDMTTEKFWGAAFLQGGGLGIMGDMLYTSVGGNDRSGRPNWANLAGPVFGDVADVIDLTAGNIGEAYRGEDTMIGAEMLKFTKGHLPFVNLWYARTAIDRAVLNDLQEFVSPGYNRRMQGFAKKEWGQEFWAPPGADFEDFRAPDFGAAIGE